MVYFVTERVTSLRASYTMKETVRSMLRSWMEKFEDGTSNKEWVDCDKRKFNRILEEQAVFIPKFQVDALFQEIDVDENESIVKSELQAFVNIKRNKFATIFKTVVTDIIFWANWIWFIGCVLYLVALYTDGQSTNVMRQWGGICFLLGGVNVTVSYLLGKIESLEYAENVRRALTTLLPPVPEQS